MQYGQMLNNDYWSKTNFDEGVRQYEQTFAENVRQFDTSFAENQRQYNESLAEQKRQHNEQMSYNWANLNSKKSDNGSVPGGLKLSTAELNAALEANESAGGGENGFAAAVSRLRAMGINIDESNAAILMDALNGTPSGVGETKSGIDWLTADITKSKNTVNGIFGLGNWTGNIDSNDVYTVNGKEYYAKDIEAAMEEDGIPEATIKKILKQINGLSENGTYKYTK
jgi:hypothetical protein